MHRTVSYSSETKAMMFIEDGEDVFKASRISLPDDEVLWIWIRQWLVWGGQDLLANIKNRVLELNR